MDNFQQIVKNAEEAFEKWSCEQRDPASRIDFISGYMMAVHKMGLLDFEKDKVVPPYLVKNKSS